MDAIQIRGGKPLTGTIDVSGSKNAALPILFASLLTEKEIILDRIPKLEDVRTSLKVLEALGVQTSMKVHTAKLCAKKVNNVRAPYDLVRTMRASVISLGPLVARFGKAEVSLPGGCAIGTRPVDLHLFGLKKLGATIDIEGGYIHARVKGKKLRGEKIDFAFPSVGATENILMAACLAKGETLMTNCAREPEIIDLARMLRGMGAEIQGEGTSIIRVQGKSSLDGCRYKVMGDRIEAGTYLSAALATLGSVTVNGIEPAALESVLQVFEKMGAQVKRGENKITVSASVRSKAVSIATEPFPGFPTDMQAQLMAVMCLGKGDSTVMETIFENRYMHVPELQRLGAQIEIEGNKATIKGVKGLSGATVMATDLRASASLIIAGLCASGETVVRRIYHLDRGYESLEAKLSSLGADVKRIKEK